MSVISIIGFWSVWFYFEISQFQNTSREDDGEVEEIIDDRETEPIKPFYNDESILKYKQEVVDNFINNDTSENLQEPEPTKAVNSEPETPVEPAAPENNEEMESSPVTTESSEQYPQQNDLVEETNEEATEEPVEDMDPTEVVTNENSEDVDNDDVEGEYEEEVGQPAEEAKTGEKEKCMADEEEVAQEEEEQKKEMAAEETEDDVAEEVAEKEEKEKSTEASPGKLAIFFSIIKEIQESN